MSHQLLQSSRGKHPGGKGDRLPPPAAPAAGHTCDAEALRRCAWEIGEMHLADTYTPAPCHIGLAMVSPCEGFAHWRMTSTWVDQTARSRGPAWNQCRPVVRLYDVSYIEFNGFNAHRLQDHTLPGLCGQLFFKLARPGTAQLAEVGFLLRNGEFIPAARSRTTSFAPDAPTPNRSQHGLLVAPGGHVEPIGNVWDQERILARRQQPQLRTRLRIAALAFESLPSGQQGTLPRFVSELAVGKCAAGHEVHVFVPATEALPCDRMVDGVAYHALGVTPAANVWEQAQAFGRAAHRRLQECGPFDLVHRHEWMTGLGPRPCPCVVLSLSSIEATRRGGLAVARNSAIIEEAEGAAARAADRVLTPHWLRDRAARQLNLNLELVAAFALEGRNADEWEGPLDAGQVKIGIGIGPFDRILLYVGPLEYAAGVDLLVEALPTLVQRWPNLRLVYVGAGELHGQLQHRAHQLGLAHMVQLLGHVEGPPLTRLLRSADALVLPSRFRVPFDDAVVDLARRAGRPVITTHGGPAHLVRHEVNGIVTYDNPGSMVWAMDRLLGDPGNADRMGRNGRSADRSDAGPVVWTEVARHYLELCAGWFPALTDIHKDN
jgi:glycosyltransferase involved in cell wall biosynthesis